MQRWVPLLMVVALVAGGCVSSNAKEDLARRKAAAAISTSTTSSTTSTSTTTPTTVAAPAAAPGAPAAPLPGLGPGANGPEVEALERRLVELKYDPGKVDQGYDSSTGHAVMAFQKANGLPRTSRATDDVMAALTTAAEPAPMLADGGPDRVEIDLQRQVLLLYKGGSLVRALSVSTGNNKRYCVGGACATAVTPGGSFRVTRKIRGLRVSRLGKLYNPLYFNGGIAIHGSASVPASPASHGCVRIPMHVSLWFHDNVPNGTPVYVIGGRTAPVPFGEQAPPDDATTTSVPTSELSPTTTFLTPTTEPFTTVPPVPEPTTTLVPEPTTVPSP